MYQLPEGFVLSIPENSVVTKEMVQAFAHYHMLAETDLEGVVGTLVGFEQGKGELDAWLFDAPMYREHFAPLRKAYFAAKGLEEPVYSKLGHKETVKDEETAEPQEDLTGSEEKSE